MLQNRAVELIASRADGLGDDDAAHGDDGNLGRAATEIDDHRPRRILDRKIGTDGGCHRLLDQIGLACACRDRRLEDSALLDRCHP